MNFANISFDNQLIVNSTWTMSDYIGALRVRSSIGRNKYVISPGLYRLGNPGKEDRIFVSANYKLSFDVLRRSLTGMNAWILVLDTKGINVWCAAGKGTFGTEELIKQIREAGLEHLVSNRELIVPQLGAPGVSGFKVKNATGFNVEFGPVRSDDIMEYIAAGRKKTQAMRTVRFNLKDRLILTMVEIVNSLKYLGIAMILVLLLSGITSGGFSFSTMINKGLTEIVLLILSYLTGCFITPILLPWLPTRYFAAKGLFAGFLIFMMVFFLRVVPFSGWSLAGWLLLFSVVSSFLAMNFTGASTYTSLSGVKKEMRIFVPVQIVMVLTGLALIIVSKFV
ncbi:MAG: hypothetical protein JXA77_05070 [Bacteroidales bacterium]|nr:hypothetical protein [Bacteroidales bacterium]MBN2820419.1 hypothetical protein [Bacteroidales bacterium]